MPATIRNSIFIQRSVDEVFAFVTDPTTTPQWQSNLVLSEPTPGPLGVGTRVREVRSLGKAESEAEWEITTYEPLVRRGYVYPKGFGPIRQQGETTFESIDGGTRIHFIAVIVASFPMNLLLPLLAQVMRQQNEKSFAKLKQLLETSSTSAIHNTSQGIAQ